MEQTGVKAFLKRKNVNITVKTYLIDAMGAMAFGLFASLLIGTIFGTLGDKTQVALFQTIAEYCKSATGAALGVSIAYALHAPQLVLFSGKNRFQGNTGRHSRYPRRYHYFRCAGCSVCRPWSFCLYDCLRQSGKNHN